MKSPFKFLDSYQKEDKHIFFGREKETDELYNLVSQNRLVLLYGTSGTGKTSLIQCGLGNRFPATDWFPLFIRRGNNLNESFKKVLEETLGEKIEGSYTDAIQDLYMEYLRPVYLIFDQFEEIFVLGDEEEQKNFIKEIAALNSAQLPCQIIISLREEYLGHLYDFESSIPHLFDSRLRVEPMRDEKVEEVIKKSCKSFNISLRDPDKNANLIREKVKLDREGISLPYLQVYLDRLYLVDLERTYRDQIPPNPELEFNESEINELGGIGNVLKIFIQEQSERIEKSLIEKYPNSPEQAVRKVLGSFASLKGTKIPQEKSQIKIGGLADQQLSFILESFQDSRVLREADGTYELSHDILASRISEQRSASEIALLEIVDLIKSRMHIPGIHANKGEQKAASSQGVSFLNEREVQLIENYEAELKAEDKLNPQQWKFIKESKSELSRAKKRWNTLVYTAIAVLASLLVLIAWQWNEARNNLSDLKKAQSQIEKVQIRVAKRELENNQAAILHLDYEKAFQTLKDVYALEVPVPGLRNNLIGLAYYFNEIDKTDKRDELIAILDTLNGKIPSEKGEALSRIEAKDYFIELANKEVVDSISNQYYPSMVNVRGGSFFMGGLGPTNVLREVELPDFQIGKVEVSVFQYELYLKNIGKKLEDLPQTPAWDWEGDNPVIYVSWYDAVRYCNWLSDRNNLEAVYSFRGNIVDINSQANGYRLPTEAEWEFAAGGGLDGRDQGGRRKNTFAGSDNLGEVAWCYLNAGNRTHSVGTKKANLLGIYDMSGNVFEWCQDWYTSYRNSVKLINPQGPKKGKKRTARGGSWYSDGKRPERQYLINFRGVSVADTTFSGFGFRVARNAH